MKILKAKVFKTFQVFFAKTFQNQKLQIVVIYILLIFILSLSQFIQSHDNYQYTKVLIILPLTIRKNINQKRKVFFFL